MKASKCAIKEAFTPCSWEAESAENQSQNLTLWLTESQYEFSSQLYKADWARMVAWGLEWDALEDPDEAGNVQGPRFWWVLFARASCFILLLRGLTLNFQKTV